MATHRVTPLINTLTLKNLIPGSPSNLEKPEAQEQQLLTAIISAFHQQFCEETPARAADSEPSSNTAAFENALRVIDEILPGTIFPAQTIEAEKSEKKETALREFLKYLPAEEYEEKKSFYCNAAAELGKAYRFIEEMMTREPSAPLPEGAAALLHFRENTETVRELLTAVGNHSAGEKAFGIEDATRFEAAQKTLKNLAMHLGSRENFEHLMLIYQDIETIKAAIPPDQRITPRVRIPRKTRSTHPVTAEPEEAEEPETPDTAVNGGPEVVPNGNEQEQDGGMQRGGEGNEKSFIRFGPEDFPGKDSSLSSIFNIPNNHARSKKRKE